MWPATAWRVGLKTAGLVESTGSQQAAQVAATHEAFATIRVPVALKLPYASIPTARPRRCKDSAVISALTEPIETRTLLPSSVMLAIGAAMTFIAESCGRSVETVTSHG